MNGVELTVDAARKLVGSDKDLLATDESNPTCNKRFAKLGIPQTLAARCAYRELIVTTPGLGESISGAILYDETIRRQKKQPALELCQGEEDQVFKPQQALYHRARFNRAAHAGKYTATVVKNMHTATKYPGAGESCGIANIEE